MSTTDIQCVLPTCGNGRVDPGENCDDGNNLSGDGCPADCGPPCGDGIRDPGEACDDKNLIGGDGCSSDCRSTETCGNGVVDRNEACDDGNQRSHDGCSSRCSIEHASWIALDVAPEARANHVIVYDAARGTIVLFGGNGPEGPSSDTWEWDSVNWRQREPGMTPPSPPSRSDHAMVYDAARRRVVMFGGGGPIEHSTWEWDGGNWKELLPKSYPPIMPSPQLRGSAMTYDAARQRVMLFGGLLGTVYQNQTWEWDGTTWHQLTTVMMPPARAWHAMAYDSQRGKVVLFGGISSGQHLSDTWEFDGTTWVQRTDPGAPASRAHHGMTFDAAHGTVVLFGGDGDLGLLSDTWEWNGTQWLMKNPTTAPPPRLGAAMAYDIVRSKVVLFGGQQLAVANVSAASLSNDTWEWDGDIWIERTLAGLPSGQSREAIAYDQTRATTVIFGGLSNDGIEPLNATWAWEGLNWIKQASTNSPPPRSEHAMAFDIARGKAVLFGGADPRESGLDFDDTWEWNGTSWLEQTPFIRPVARRSHAMVYDTAREKTLLLGGIGQGGSVQLSDQWTWDGTSWTPNPVIPPPWRMDFALAYDAARERVVMFGGRTDSTLLRDVWEWDGTTWIDRTDTQSSIPQARFGHSLVYDSSRHKVVLFGGQGLSGGLNDIWEWNGIKWTHVSTASMPSRRHHHAMIYDAAREHLMMFGGEDATSASMRDAWFLRYDDPISFGEACYTGFDGDGDGKVGCEDPDCNAFCERCGNEVCDALESCRLCPDDCGMCLVCGDFQCDPGETCASCPGDCGRCQDP